MTPEHVLSEAEARMLSEAEGRMLSEVEAQVLSAVEAPPEDFRLESLAVHAPRR